MGREPSKTGGPQHHRKSSLIPIIKYPQNLPILRVSSSLQVFLRLHKGFIYRRVRIPISIYLSLLNEIWRWFTLMETHLTQWLFDIMAPVQPRHLILSSIPDGSSSALHPRCHDDSYLKFLSTLSQLNTILHCIYSDRDNASAGSKLYPGNPLLRSWLSHKFGQPIPE